MSVDPDELIAAALDGGPVQAMVREQPARTGPHGVIGVDVSGRSIDGHPWTVVQLLLDDDHPLFDAGLLDGPVVAEVRTRGHQDAPPALVALEPFDHEAFRRRLLAERQAGDATTRGVLVLTGGALPPPYVRLAFLPMALAETAGTELVVRRTSVAALVAGAERAHERGEISDDQRRALLISIEQRHPTPSA